MREGSEPDRDITAQTSLPLLPAASRGFPANGFPADGFPAEDYLANELPSHTSHPSGLRLQRRKIEAFCKSGQPRAAYRFAARFSHGEKKKLRTIF